MDREGQKKFGVMDTTKRKLIYEGVELSPTKFVCSVVTQKGWPNEEIIFLGTGESLGDARGRGAVVHASARAPRAQWEREKAEAELTRRTSRREKKQSIKAKQNDGSTNSEKKDEKNDGGNSSSSRVVASSLLARSGGQKTLNSMPQSCVRSELPGGCPPS